MIDHQKTSTLKVFISQCSLPAFRGLFHASHRQLIHNLLFELLTWHALAKLRKHSLATVAELDASTTRLGSLLRKFARETAEAYETRDLPSEKAKKARAKAAKLARGSKAPGHPSLPHKPHDDDDSVSKKRLFSLTTAKLHGLGHVPDAIVEICASDGCNTMVVRTFPNPLHRKHLLISSLYWSAHRGRLSIDNQNAGSIDPRRVRRVCLSREYQSRRDVLGQCSVFKRTGGKRPAPKGRSFKEPDYPFPSRTLRSFHQQMLTIIITCRTRRPGQTLSLFLSFSRIISTIQHYT